MERNTILLGVMGVLGLAELITSGIFGLSNPLFGALFVFILPGYVVAATVFDLRSWRLAERILLSVGLSVAIDIVSGLLINLSSDGLVTTSWGAVLGAITVGGALVALVRWWGKPTRRQADAAMPPDLRKKSFRDTYFASPLVCVMALVSVVTVAGAFAISLFAAQNTPSAGFTQLWLLPPTGSASVQIGVRNEEQTTKEYIVQLTASGSLVYTWNNISLEPGQSWTTTAPLPADVANSSFQVPVEATLYLADAPNQPYRQTLIWVGSSG
jgi:uncharacterized membrane protein